MARDVKDLRPDSLLIAVIALSVSLAWNGVINTTFDTIAEDMGRQNGLVEIFLRAAFATLLTLGAVFIVPKLVIAYRTTV